MTTVTLHGALGLAMGREVWQLDIRQPREAIAAIEANTRKLYTYLRETKGAEYRVIINGKDHGSVQDLYLEGDFETIEIVPVPAGSAGLWQTIIGVVLIIVGVVMLFTPATAAFAPYVISVGLSITLSGIAQMLSPTPKLGTGSTARQFRPMNEQLQTKKEEKGSNGNPSYLFSGAVNTTAQGNPVPIVYGEHVIGSQMISLAITSTSVDETIIASQHPPVPDDGFFDLAVWARLEADSRALLVPSVATVRSIRVSTVVAIAPDFDIPDVYPSGLPKEGEGIPIGNSRLPRRSKRAYLATASHLFTNHPRGITFREAVDLYKVLELTSVTNLPRASWKQVVLAVALHYSPDP